MFRKNRSGYGRTEFAIGAAVLVVITLIAVPLMTGPAETTNNNELQEYVEGIRAAEIAYKAQFGEYISADPAPRRPESVNDQPITWTPTRGFKTLSWSPVNTAQVAGSYRISVNGDSFKITGTADLDNDGIRATYTATESQPAKRITDESIH